MAQMLRRLMPATKVMAMVSAAYDCRVFTPRASNQTAKMPPRWPLLQTVVCSIFMEWKIHVQLSRVQMMLSKDLEKVQMAPAMTPASRGLWCVLANIHCVSLISREISPS